jgi:hypothetical protein
MAAGVVLNRSAAAINAVDDVIDQARSAFAAGVRQVWLAQQFDHDAISLAGLIGAAVPGPGVGTFVVPINPRHPLVVASLAQTAQAASHGNFSLGLGLGAHTPSGRPSVRRGPTPSNGFGNIFKSSGRSSTPARSTSMARNSQRPLSGPSRCRAARRCRCTYRRWGPRPYG